MEFGGLACLLAFILWGATTKPGRPFSWTMYSGSSKPFLWVDAGGRPRWASLDDIGLAPDAHYLRRTDLQRLVEEGDLCAFEGLIIESQGSWLVACDATTRCLTSEPIADGEDLKALAETLRRFEFLAQ